MRTIKPRLRQTGVGLAAVGVAVVGFAMPALAAEITSGGFEPPDVTAGTCSTALGGTGDLGGGWTVVDGCVGIHTSTATSVEQYEGTQHVDFAAGAGDPVGTISQTFVTEADVDYIITFAYGNNYACGLDNPETLTVTVDGQAHTDTINVPASTGQDPEWTTSGYLFRATGTSSTVTFAQTSGPDDGCGVLLDDVRVVLDPDLPLVDPRVAAGAGAAAVGGLAVYGLRRRSRAAA